MDIHQIFLNDENNEYIPIILQRKLAEIMIKMAPKLYRKKYVITNSKGELLLYVKLDKSCKKTTSPIWQPGK